jgi:hypothetical protein
MQARALQNFFNVCRLPRISKRLLTGTFNGMGRRVFPPMVKKYDERLGYRIDQGSYFKDGRFVLITQQNGKPHGPTLAATVVDPKLDEGEDVVDRLVMDAKKRGNL